MLQILTQMMLTEAEFGVVAALVIGNFGEELQTYPIARNPSTEDSIRRAVAAFWQNIEDGIEPTIDYERDGPLLSVLFPREIPGKVIDLRADNRMPDLLNRLEEIDAQLKTLKAERSAIDTEIRSKAIRN